jgi:cytidine deaminase
MDIEKYNPELLVKYALQAMENAYAPYSKYRVGAAVLADNDTIYTGCNIENAVYPLTSCAERVAITKAISDGVKRIHAVAVATKNGGTPCGSCRQIMREFGDDNLPIYIAGIDGQYEVYSLAQLLPLSFTSADIETQ